ncbi:MAG: nucleotidyltransferase domain-containing protein [Candidatus Aenigmarchaeota archaeon]|nr:nucleotidyltransferase domain-containing protein [Candidatus Aenigmarchaeota archaeon]
MIRDLIKPVIHLDNIILSKKITEFSKQIEKFSKTIILFGSANKNNMKPTSDIDIAVISDKNIESHVDKIKTSFLKKDSVIFSVHIYRTRDFKKNYETNDPLVKDIANGKILYGNIDDII